MNNVQQLLPLSARGDLLELARSFPTLANVPERFFEVVARERSFKFGTGADGFAWWAQNGGSGQRHAALFVLGVFNARTVWEQFGDLGGKFDAHYALGIWDPTHRDAFVRWASAPWWL